MTSHHSRHPARRTLRRVMPVTVLLLLAGGLAACTDDDPAEDPSADATSESPADPSGEADGDATEPSEPEESEESEESEVEEITPPGAELAFDESALVALSYSLPKRTSGVYRISMDSIETAPLSLLDRAGVEQPTEPSELYLVRQTFEMVDRGNDDPGLASLIGHTQMVDADGVEAEHVNADVPGCEFDSFRRGDQPGRERKACNAFVVPTSAPPVSVTYFTITKRYDALQGGDFIYWPVQDVTAS